MNLNAAQNPTIAFNSKKEYLKIAFYVIWIGGIIIEGHSLNVYILTLSLKSVFFGALFYLLTIYFIYQLIWMLFGKTTLKVLDGTLVVNHILFIFKKEKSFVISNVSDIKSNINIKASTYQGFMGVRIYDRISFLTFKYNNKEITLGKDLSENDVISLKSWLDTFV
jgi:hypothetical protein